MEKINENIRKASHSGACLEVINDNKEIVVIKTFLEKDERNEIAIKKQKTFSSITTSAYGIQSIGVSTTRLNDCIVAKMPYVEGISGSQVAIHGNRQLANNIRISINIYLMTILAGAREKKIYKSVITDKLNEVKSKGVAEYIKPEFNKGCDWIENRCPDILVIPMGQCHGDLTLSNIIISQDNKMHLFDFLDTYIESPLQDVSKLIQDMKYGWSFRHERAGIRLKGQLFCESAYPGYIESIMRIYPKELEVFNVMTILRIAPYISEEDMDTLIWFKRTVNKMFGELC